MTTTRLFHLFFLTVFIILFSAMITAQVKINERIEIKPSARIMADVNSSSGDLETLIDYIDYSQGSPYTRIYFVRTCVVTVDCSLQCTRIPAPVGVILNNSVNITDNSETVTSYCECEWCGQSFPIHIWNYSNGLMVIDGVSVTTSSRSAHISIQGRVTYPKQEDSFSAEIEIIVVPYNEPVIEQIDKDVNLELNATGVNNPLSLYLIASSIASTGGNFLMCARSVPAIFKIENPLKGVELEYTRDDGTKISNTVSVEADHRVRRDGWADVKFIWDGSSLPNSDDTTITVSVSRFGLSDTCKVKLIKILPHHFDIEPDTDMIMATESVPIRVIARTINNEEEPFFGDKEVTLYAPYGGSFIVGSDTLIDEATVTYQVARSGAVKYLPYYGVPWTGTESAAVPLKVWRTDHPEREGEGFVNVMPFCMVINTSAKEIGVGDSIQMDFMMKNPEDGSLVPFEEGQLFGVWMNTDEKYGKLRCISTGEEGSFVTGPQPFEFIAADSLDVSSTVAEIEVMMASSGGGGGGSASILGTGIKDISQRAAGLLLKSQINNNVTNGSIRTTIMERTASRSIEKLIKKLYADREKAKNKSQFNRIIAKIEAKYADKIKVIKDTDDEKKSLKKSEQISKSEEEGASCGLPYTEVLIGGSILVVDSLTGNDVNQFIAGTDLPKMPNPIIKAQLKNFNNGTNGEVEFNWTLTIKWKVKGIDFSTPLDATEKYTGTATGQNSEIVDLEIGQTLYGETDMRGGDDITLTVTCTTKVDNKIYVTSPTEKKNPFVIQGKNPENPTLLAELRNPARYISALDAYNGDPYIAISWMESTFQQFESGYPKHGKEKDTKWDFGLMGINHPDNYSVGYYLNDNDYGCDDIIWNWVANVQQGKLYYEWCYSNALEYHLGYKDPSGTAKNTPLTNDKDPITGEYRDQLFLESYCEYNGGVGQWYWKWNVGDPQNGKLGFWDPCTDVTKQEKPSITGNANARKYAVTVNDFRKNKPWPTK